MSRHDLVLHSAAYSGLAETHIPIDTLIGTGLRRAFPLPGEGQCGDESFRQLLAALARCQGRASQPVTSLAGSRS